MVRQDLGLSQIMMNKNFASPDDPARNQAGFSLAPCMAATIGVQAADLRKAFPEIKGAKFGVIFAECYPPTPIEAVLLNTTGVGLTNMIMRTDQDILPREQRLRALPPLHQSSMVDHYKDAIERQLKLYVARSHRNTSVPHDPDRACELEWIYLPRQVAPVAWLSAYHR